MYVLILSSVFCVEIFKLREGNKNAQYQNLKQAKFYQWVRVYMYIPQGGNKFIPLSC